MQYAGVNYSAILKQFFFYFNKNAMILKVRFVFMCVIIQVKDAFHLLICESQRNLTNASLKHRLFLSLSVGLGSGVGHFAMETVATHQWKRRPCSNTLQCEFNSAEFYSGGVHLASLCGGTGFLKNPWVISPLRAHVDVRRGMFSQRLLCVVWEMT